MEVFNPCRWYSIDGSLLCGFQADLPAWIDILALKAEVDMAFDAVIED